MKLDISIINQLSIFSDIKMGDKNCSTKSIFYNSGKVFHNQMLVWRELPVDKFQEPLSSMYCIIFRIPGLFRLVGFNLYLKYIPGCPYFEV